MIVDLDDYRPHCTIYTGDNAHVYPMKYFEDLVSGVLDLDTLEPEVNIQIIKEWVEKL